MTRSTRAAIAMAAVVVAGGLAVLILRSQIKRHRRNLFSPRPFRRLAALGHIGREPASVDAIRLLRDFVAWEPRKMLRDRARSIMARMTEEVGEQGVPGAEPA